MALEICNMVKVKAIESVGTADREWRTLSELSTETAVRLFQGSTKGEADKRLKSNIFSSLGKQGQR